MYGEALKKHILKVLPFLIEIRECYYCAYETDQQKCPKCNSHSFVKYIQYRWKQVA